ncbi:hypothetical protein K3G39_19005 [Pontibacter sp. HSC-14F20]|uniref:lanthionine synthetase LanC family protein n=1 Tax=Pontibacter sp. HSC-14F20 TaxID=2864136 RepID=UPI001C73A29A|nr:lanthionine synthetase LanC family protein [Pontibacter sp. HSC-14F20]MBX0335329.1 hypothetical protein [Pontibacter sp. HSC-14F20]
MMNELLVKEQVPVSTATQAELSYLLTRIEASVSSNIAHLENSTLSSGWLGACLFYCQYAQYTGNDLYFEKAKTYLDKALERADYKFYKRVYPTDSYDANIAGLGTFLLKSAEQGYLNFDASSWLEHIEGTLHLLCKNKLEQADFSIFSGALATGNFLLSAPGSAPNQQLLAEIVESIERHAIPDPSGGIYWTSPRLHNKVYLGISHGSCMIISFLCGVFERGLLKDKCQALIGQAAAFVLKCKRNNPKGLFPHVLGEGVQDTQFSLCYGDLGVGYGLLKGGLATGNEDLVAEAREVLGKCLERTYEDGLTYDGSMTYGASGVAYLFRKLSKLDPAEAKYQQAYQYWIHQIPRYATGDNEFCGFQSFFKPESGLFNLSYGWGIIGIGVAVMQFLNEDLPTIEGINHGI